MAYRIKLNEPADRAYRRIVTEQIERSVEHLRSGQDRVTAVHETRKAMKRVRALARLLRHPMGEATYRAENVRYRDIARLLAGARDIDVLRATSAGLAKGRSKSVRMAAQALVEHAAEVAKSGEHAPHVEDAVMALEDAKAAIADLTFDGRGFEAIRPGLEKGYRAGRRRMDVAYKSGEDEAFHDLRKLVQAHWRHMAVLDGVWPDMMGARAKLARDAAELLGEDHDLYVFINAARAAAAQSDDAGAFETLIDAAKRRQRDIRRELLPKAEVLYAETASAFADRIGQYWAAARDAKKAERATRAGSVGSPEAKADPDSPEAKADPDRPEPDTDQGHPAQAAAPTAAAPPGPPAGAAKPSRRRPSRAGSASMASATSGKRAVKSAKSRQS